MATHYSLLTLLILFILTIPVQAQITPPYYNNFELPGDTAGWSHYASSGTDDWEMGIPDYSNFYPLTGEYAWVTNLTGAAAPNSIRMLETPSFDLSDTTQVLTLEFYRKNVGGHSTVEYSTDEGQTWELFNDPDNQQFQWHNPAQLPQSSSSFLTVSRVSLTSLMGHQDVRFRFRYSTGNNPAQGWLIDDFRIRQSIQGLVALPGDTIWNKNKYSTTANIDANYSVAYDWSTTINPVEIRIYFSDDDVFDADDTLLYVGEDYLFESSNEFSVDVNFPENLWAGLYYFFYELIPSDSDLVDDSENINYAVMRIDSIYTPPYKTDFETPVREWGTGQYAPYLSWERGDPDFFNLEDPRSGNKGWYSASNISNNSLETAFFNLSDSIDNVFCIWYRNFGDDNDVLWFSYAFPEEGNIPGTPHYYPSGNIYHSMRRQRAYLWECHCRDLSEFNGMADFRFVFRSVIANGYAINYIDDFYIGPPLPDLAIEGEKKYRFTSVEREMDTLYYVLYNGGLADAPASQTEFWWSEDELLDEEDVYLGSKTEIGLPDTSLTMSHFAFEKPTQAPGTYYLIYKLDAEEEIEEIWESTNIGAIQIEQKPLVSLPYFNDFETHHDEWSHDATVGNNEWVRASPSGQQINEAFSGEMAFVTNDTGLVSTPCRMHLFTPVFDLTQLDHPVMEFNLHAFNHGNIMVSLDGGASWNALVQQGASNKGMYSGESVSNFPGHNGVEATGNQHTQLLYGLHEPYFNSDIDQTFKWRDDLFSRVIDLSHFGEYSQVQFMFVYAQNNLENEGMIMDDFGISEATSDLHISNTKSLMASSQDTRFIHNFIVKNNQNYITPVTFTKLYLSTDDELNDDDYLLASKATPPIKPYHKHYFNIDEGVPDNYAEMNYLLVHLDATELVAESIESNNIVAFPLSMDTASTMQLPILYDFNDPIVHGWAWHHDSTGVHMGAQLRQIAEGMPTPNNVESGMWYTERFYSSWGGESIDNYPLYSLDSPPYDFSHAVVDSISFDLLCMGTDNWQSTQGGNLQYSLDGGEVWQVLQSPGGLFNSTNVYDLQEVSTLNDEPGWADDYSMTYTSREISFLSGEPYVKFRFRFKSNKDVYGGSGNFGFRVDNFRITGQSITTMLDPIFKCPYDYVVVFGDFEVSEGIYVQTLTDINGGDSIIGQEVINHPTYEFIEDEVVCQGDDYTFPDGSTLTNIHESLTYESEFETQVGCDSTVVTNLSVVEIDTTVSVNNNILETNHSSGQFQWFNCTTNELIPNPFPFIPLSGLPPGYYAAEIIDNGCVFTTECYPHLVNSYSDPFSESGYQVFPIPTEDGVAVRFESPVRQIQWELLDITYRTLRTGSERGSTEFYITIPGEAGTYFLRLRTDDSSESLVRIIKQ